MSPAFIVEDFGGGAPTTVTVVWADLPHEVVWEMALSGDQEAIDWLKANPKKGTTAGAEAAWDTRGRGRHYIEGGHTATGQTRTNFTNPTTGKPMSKTETGDTFEQLFADKGAAMVADRFCGGCPYTIVAHADGGSRTTPLDGMLGHSYGVEVKTLSADTPNQKTAIKAEELARKADAVAEAGVKPLLVVQVVDQATGTVKVYGYPAFASKAVSRMEEIGSYHYGARDFARAQATTGHSAKAVKSKGRLDYDPPDGPGGVLEPGDTLVQLHDGVPYVSTVPKRKRDQGS